MQTKLVYVLTCAPEATYIEQALISIWSARYHNPDAHIVLIVDYNTHQLLVGKRTEILKYISEELVVEVPVELSAMQASRWLKTSVRNLINGDFLFIDCDTIVTQNLSEIDLWDCQIGAVLDSHQTISTQLMTGLSTTVDQENFLLQASKCGWDFTSVEYYRSSGIIYVKDTIDTRKFYMLWHKNYLHSRKCGISIDQLSLEKTTQEMPIVSDIDDVWNAVMYTRPIFIEKAKIIHFTFFKNNSFLFSKRVLRLIRDRGLSDYFKYYIKHPMLSFFPFLKKYFIGIQFYRTLKDFSVGVCDYAREVDDNFLDLKIPHCISPIIINLFRHHCYFIGTFIWLLWIRLTGKYNPFEKYHN